MPDCKRVRYLRDFFPEVADAPPHRSLQLERFSSSQDDKLRQRARNLGKGAEVELVALTSSYVRHARMRVRVLDRDPSWGEPIGREIMYLGEFQGKEGLVFNPDHVSKVFSSGVDLMDCPALEPTPFYRKRETRYAVKTLESGFGEAVTDVSGEVQLVVPEGSSMVAAEICDLLNCASRLHGGRR